MSAADDEIPPHPRWAAIEAARRETDARYAAAAGPPYMPPAQCDGCGRTVERCACDAAEAVA